VLESFSGTILLVSHDRYLVDRLASQIWELRQGKLNVYRGTYRDFMLQRAATVYEAVSRPAILLQKPLFRVDGREARKRAQSLALLEERIHEQEMAVRRLSSEIQRAGQTKAFERMNQLSARWR